MEIQDLTIRTGKQQSFVHKLGMLCEEYSSDGDFDFEAYTDESNDEVLIISSFYIETTNEQGFLKELEALRKAFEVPTGQVLEFEEIEEGEFFEIYEFYIRTDKQADFIKKLEELCDKFSIENDYSFEDYIDDEDEAILYIEDFYIATEQPLEFVDNLEKLCKQFALDDEFGFGFDGEEEEA